MDKGTQHEEGRACEGCRTRLYVTSKPYERPARSDSFAGLCDPSPIFALQLEA
jgi:hypothetical protein